MKAIERNKLIRFSARIFMACGVPEQQAFEQSMVLVAADARGIPSHGIARLPRYVAGLQQGSMIPNIQPEAIKETLVSLLVDARGGLGAPVSIATMKKVIEKAELAGMSFAAVRNSNHFGIAGYYAMMALPHDMIGMAMTNTAALGVPTHARQVMFGTNPIAFAAPAFEEKAFVLDMSTTAVTRGKIEVFARLGKPLPRGWAVDRDGAPAGNANALLDDMLHRSGGGLVPLGGDDEIHAGYKGYGLGVMVDILTGVLSGGLFGQQVADTETTSARVSHCFAAMKIDMFQKPEEFKKSMDSMLKALRTAEPARGKARVYYAGQKEYEAEEEASKFGIKIDDTTFRILTDLGKKFDINPEDLLFH